MICSILRREGSLCKGVGGCRDQNAIVVVGSWGLWGVGDGRAADRSRGEERGCAFGTHIYMKSS